MKYISLSFLLVGTLTLATCAPATSPHGGGPKTHGNNTASQKTRLLQVQQETGQTPSDLAFSIRENGNMFTDYGVSHTKEMHLIVVRDDLLHFQHLHPTRDAQGIWHVDFKPGAGGTYWIYADFVDSTMGTYTIRYENDFSGNKGPYGIVKNFEKVKTVDGYRFELQPAATGEEISFNYRIMDTKGNLIQVEQYLGARGHSVIISPSGGFIHAHASDEGELPVFIATLPSGFYRMFTQFQIKGKVVTVNFDWQQ